MYVCLCFGVSDKKIIDAKTKGVNSLAELQRSCPVGTNCGSCVPFVKQMLCQKEQNVATDGNNDKAAAR